MTEQPRMLGARVFVTIVYLILGLSFPVTLIVLAYEFKTDWPTIAAFDSNIFIFYPVLGPVALAAFYVPSIIFTHLYWNLIPYGRVRFIIGTICLVIAAFWIAHDVNDKERLSAWQFAPAVAAQRLESAGCGPAGAAACPSESLLQRLDEVRVISGGRIGLSKLARECMTDALLETPRDNLEQRFCAISKTKTNAEDCCKAQLGFAAAVHRLDSAKPSLTYEVHRLLLPLKYFFLLVLIVIGLMLTFWLRKLDAHYASFMPRIEKGLLIGAFIMLFWPLMDYGHDVSAAVLYGRMGVPLMASLLVVPWTLLLLFNFLRRVSERWQTFGKVAGGAAGAFAVIKYDQVIDLSSRFTGSGAGLPELALLAFIVVAATVFLMLPSRPAHQPEA